MPYITQFNAERIINKDVQVTKLDFCCDLYKRKIDIFNKKYEEKRILAVKAFFENPENIFNEKYKKYKKPIKSSRTIYEDKINKTKPAYHNINTCPKLLSDFSDFYFPPQIENQGEEVMLLYKEWFEEEGKRFLENDFEKFKDRLFTRFQAGLSKGGAEQLKILYKNSGCDEIDSNIDNLEKKIDDLIIEADNFIDLSEKNKIILEKYKRYAYLWRNGSPLLNNDTGYSDKEVFELLEFFEKNFKQKLEKSLKIYYRVKSNPKLEFKKELLKQLGFNECSTCYCLPIDLDPSVFKK